MDLKVNIGLLEGKSNWATWKYKIRVLLRSIPQGEDIISGNLCQPNEPKGNPPDEKEVSDYKVKMNNYRDVDTKVLLALTTNMTEETLTKVMRFNSAREIWLELHRLYEGVTEDKTFDLCMQFFTYKYECEDDMANHLSKLKNIWTNLNLELNVKEKLPDILLICKILDTLPEKYFAFKSSWQMIPKSERSVENLTSQLCAHERALRSTSSSSFTKDIGYQEALTLSKGKGVLVSKGSKNKIVCHYCKKEGHVVKQCIKWKKDGRPPKQKEAGSVNSMALNITDVFTAECDNVNWFVDNGATHHVCNNKSLFKKIHSFDSPHTVTTASGDVVKALGYGDIEIKVACSKTITLSNAWFVPTINKNLFSVLAAHDRKPNSKFISTVTKCTFEVNGKVVLHGKRTTKNGLYRLDIENSNNSNPASEPTASSMTGAGRLLQLYHERFAHQNKKHTKDVIERELGIKVSNDSDLCEGCVYGKAHRLQFGERKRATFPGEVIHTDICGPFEKSFSGYRYFVLFKDDFTRFRFVHFIKEKSEAHDKFLLVLKECEQVGHKIRSIQSDNGGEFVNAQMKRTLENHGIQQLLAMPYCSEVNGFIERENRTVVEAARAMFHSQEGLPQSLWAEFINSAVYILNRTSNSGIPTKSPYELWFGKKPNIKHLRIIGSECYAHIPKGKRRKMEKKAVKGKLVGYEFGGYRIWTQGKNIVRSRDVIFNERPLTPNTTVRLPKSETDDTLRTPKEKTVTDEEDMTSGRMVDEVTKDNSCNFPNIEDGGEEHYDHFSCSSNSETKEEYSPRKLRDRSKIHAPERYTEQVSMVTSNVPETYEEALKSQDSKEWVKAMASEMNSLKENDVWTLCDLPSGRKALPCKWAFKIKENPDGTIDKYKARLVAKGFRQSKGQDYNETFSPVARLATVRALLSVAAKESLVLQQFDVTTAFLNGHLKEDIYMEQPDGFNDGTSRVCHLKRSLYGLKQAPRCWNSCFVDILHKMKFQQSEADGCLFIKKVGNKKILLTLYVDDGLVAATSSELIDDFLNELRKHVKITTKPASYYLGLEIQQGREGSIIIKQEAYTRKLLERFNMANSNPVSTPIDKENTTEAGKVDEESKFPYREAVGALSYLMGGTRPDIAYAVSVVSRKLENPTIEDWKKVKRIFRYLKGTTNFGIRYAADNTNVCIVGYSDADHAGDTTTGRSTTGVVCLYAGGVISWLSQRQASVAISTTEAEIVAASEAAREISWLQRIFSDINSMNATPILQIDNEAAIRLSHNPEFHKRTKHIRVRHFFVREMVQDNLLEVKKTSSSKQLADALTKPIPGPRLAEIRRELGMQEAPSSI